MRILLSGMSALLSVKGYGKFLMQISSLLIWLISISFPAWVFAQPKESMCKDAIKFQDYAVLGDCYRYAVGYEKSLEKAKFYYLYGAMSGSEAGEYSKLQIAKILLDDENSISHKAMGLYLLKDFSDREDVKKVTEPKYAGDFTRRGVARYLLAIYFYQENDFGGTKEYLEKALEDNYGEAAFALAYLAGAKKIPGPMTDELIKKYISVGEEKQRVFFYWDVASYSCWLKQQADRNVEGTLFPVDRTLVKSMLKEHGPCLSVDTVK